jgi:hypothetical protein
MKEGRNITYTGGNPFEGTGGPSAKKATVLASKGGTIEAKQG